MRQVLCAIEQRVDNVLSIAVEHRFELATAQRLAKGPGRHHPLSYLYADLAPLVDDPKGIELVGLIDIAVEQLESQPLGACFLQQPPRLGPRLFYVRPVAGQLLQFCSGRGQPGAGKRDAADRLHDRDPRQPRRAMPAVDSQGQRTAHPDVVERLPLVVRGDQVSTVPVTLLNGELAAERGSKLVARCWRKTTELDRRPVAADRADPDRLLVGENAGEAIGDKAIPGGSNRDCGRPKSTDPPDIP